MAGTLLDRGTARVDGITAADEIFGSERTDAVARRLRWRDLRLLYK